MRFILGKTNGIKIKWANYPSLDGHLLVFVGGVFDPVFLPEVFPFSCTLFIVVIFYLDFLIISIYVDSTL